MIFTVSPVSAAPDHIVFTIGKSSYQVDGMSINMDAIPFIKYDRIFVPVRYLAAALGIMEDNINWNASAQSVTLGKNNVNVVFSVGTNIISIDDQISKMDVTPVLKNDRVYLPARYVAQAFGYIVSWNEPVQSVLIEPSGKTSGNLSSTRPVIYGSPAFINKINETLDLLSLKSPSSWEIVAANLAAIREYDRSGADVTNRVFNVGPATASSDNYWLASTIVHDSYHVQQFLEGRVYSGEAAEAEACQKQLQALKDMNAPDYLIEHLKASMATRYWEVQYNERNW
jgi:hypothetical protein